MRFLIFILLLLATYNLHAQGNFLLRIIPADKDTGFLTKDFAYKRNQRDSMSAVAEMRSLLNKLYEKGFLEATYSSIIADSMRLSATLYTGNQWRWASLSNGNADEVMLDRIGFREKLFDGSTFSSEGVAGMMDKLLTYLENNGYPFASVKLDSLHIQEQQLHAKIFVTKNKLITVDSINVKGDAKISPK